MIPQVLREVDTPCTAENAMLSPWKPDGVNDRVKVPSRLAQSPMIGQIEASKSVCQSRHPQYGSFPGGHARTRGRRHSLSLQPSHGQSWITWQPLTTGVSVPAAMPIVLGTAAPDGREACDAASPALAREAARQEC